MLSEKDAKQAFEKAKLEHEQALLAKNTAELEHLLSLEDYRIKGSNNEKAKTANHNAKVMANSSERAMFIAFVALSKAELEAKNKIGESK